MSIICDKYQYQKFFAPVWEKDILGFFSNLIMLFYEWMNVLSAFLALYLTKGFVQSFSSYRKSACLSFYKQV